MNIVVVGSSNTDMIIKVSQLPAPGETVLGGQFIRAAGGKGANQAVAAARAGGKVTFVARVGDDMFGNSAIDGFKSDGINVDHVVKDAEAPSGVAQIMVADDGENCIAVASGANSNLSPQDIDLAINAIGKADILLTQLETPIPTIIRAVELAKSFDKKVILNPAPAHPLPDDLLTNISVITPNETEAALLTGVTVTDEESAARAALVLIGKGIESVIITMGSKGAYVHHNNEGYLVPGFEVDAVDTTAAGDTFNGALAVRLSQGEHFRDAVIFANAAAALSVTRVGAQPSVPILSEVNAFLNERR
ncbi:ribokinase [Fulvivirga sedimenti]|uniref:Ribokinase n=1 Tax=Fulvivirga sedimenti TaxID=2879465 RepID=A0A9X1HLQ7_9BACT|nr:ribokinase [Fulvivirga sedimenti]MCA6074325.1 ribokinase [Fulvivirga sedimenti]